LIPRILAAIVGEEMANVARAHLESLLRARKLDVTLTSAAAWRDAPADRLAPTGLPPLDEALGGGLRRGHLSEIVGPRSAGRTTLLAGLLAAATARGELVALVDLHDRFDPVSAGAAGVDLSRLLWIRERGDAPRAVKAMNLILQSGGFGIVVLDLADARPPLLRQFPATTWMRLARVIEGGQTVALVVAPEHLARSPGGVTIALARPASDASGRWLGDGDRGRLLRGVDVWPRVIAAR
jgi:recombination protein RecA